MSELQDDQSPQFSNTQVDMAQLAQYQHQQGTPLEPKYITANVYLRIVTSCILLLIVSIVNWQTFKPVLEDVSNVLDIALIIIACLGVFSVIFGYLSDKAKSYALRECDISFYSGVIFKKVVIQPLLRLQHIELKRGPIERKLDLATIQVFSAGGAMHTFELPGLQHEQALQLRQFILDHKDVTTHG